MRYIHNPDTCYLSVVLFIPQVISRFMQIILPYSSVSSSIWLLQCQWHSLYWYRLSKPASWLGHRYHFVWGKHENTSPCGSTVNTSYGRIASCAGTQFQTRATKFQGNSATHDLPSVLTMRPWHKMIAAIIHAWPSLKISVKVKLNQLHDYGPSAFV